MNEMEINSSKTGDKVTSKTADISFNDSGEPSDFTTGVTKFDDDNNSNSNSNSDDVKKAENDGDDGSNSSDDHSKYIWLHAFYHSIVTIIGTGILGFPYATSYLGWYGGTIFITAMSAYCYYTAILLIGLQEKGQGTYTEVADAVMGEGFSRFTVRPAQYLNFFPTAAIMILVGGTALSTIDNLDGKQTLSLKVWMVVDAVIVMVLSLLPDLNRAWQISVMGALAAFIITGYSIGGSCVALFDDSISETVEFDRPPATDGSKDQIFALMASFGDILFGYGFHAVLPDIHASLHHHSTKDSKTDMKKAITAAFSFSYPAYLVVALVGYAAFGYNVNTNVLLSINNVLPKEAMYPVWVFVTVKTATEAAVYNQAAFTLTRDIFGLTLDSDHVDHHPKNWKLDIVIRFVWVTLAALVAVYVPFFSDLTAITAAISVTPTTCLLPIIMWNKKHGATAPKWRLWCHYLFLFLSIVIAMIALIGACAQIAEQF